VNGREDNVAATAFVVDDAVVFCSMVDDGARRSSLLLEEE